MPEKKPNVFHIAFFTDGHYPPQAGAIPPGWLSAVKVTIEMDALPPETGDLAEAYNVALADHPLYGHIRRYAIANQPQQSDTPKTAAEAEELAKQTCDQYLDGCHPRNPTDVGNYLMKLVSVAGALMAKAEGSNEAALRLKGTAAFLLRAMPKSLIHRRKAN